MSYLLPCRITQQKSFQNLARLLGVFGRIYHSRHHRTCPEPGLACWSEVCARWGRSWTLSGLELGWKHADPYADTSESDLDGLRNIPSAVRWVLVWHPVASRQRCTVGRPNQLHNHRNSRVTPRRTLVIGNLKSTFRFFERMT